MEYSAERYARIAKAMGYYFNSDEEGAQKAVDAVKRLSIDVDLPSLLSLKVDISDFEKLAGMSAKNISTESNPRPMTKKDYLIVINNAYNN